MSYNSDHQEFADIRAEQARQQSSHGGYSSASAPAPDHGPAPTFNSLDGQSLTPAVDALYEYDDSDVATVDAYDPSLESVSVADPTTVSDVGDDG